MKQITIFRHGKVSIEEDKKIPACEFKDWVDRYNNSDIVFDKTAQNCKSIVEKSDIIICSSLKRSILSAKHLNLKPFKIDPVFNEAELPYAHWSMLKLSPKMWLAIFRILWFLGYSKNCESYEAAKQRAKKASSELIKLSERYDNIVLFGHGIFNRLLIKEMASSGWQITKKLESKNWSYGIIEQKRDNRFKELTNH